MDRAAHHWIAAPMPLHQDKQMRFYNYLILGILLPGGVSASASEHTASTTITVQAPIKIVRHPTLRLYQQSRGQFRCACFGPVGGAGPDTDFLHVQGVNQLSIRWKARNRVCTRWKQVSSSTGQGVGNVCDNYEWKDVEEHEDYLLRGSAWIQVKNESGWLVMDGKRAEWSTIPREYSSHQVAYHEYAICPSGENCGGTSYHGPISNELWDDLHDFSY